MPINNFLLLRLIVRSCWSSATVSFHIITFHPPHRRFLGREGNFSREGEEDLFRFYINHLEPQKI